MRGLATPLIIARRWKAPGIVVAIALVWLLWGVIANPIEVPGRTSVAADVWPLLPVLPALIVLDTAYSFADPIERTAARSRVVRKGTHVLMSSAAVALLTAFTPPHVEATVVARNAALAVGLAYLLSTFVMRSYALVLLAMLPAASWLLGSESPGHPPASWAWMMHGTESAVATIATTVVAILGGGLFLADRWSGSNE
jgi:hypothetical protein